MKRIHLIYTGGTFGMVPMRPGRTLAPGDLSQIISKYLPEIHGIADITTEVLFNLDSCDIHLPHWTKLADCIAAGMDEYDGFVVVHGTDAMVYTATALSFMLNNLPKPVIFTGSQRPISLLRSDARNNLINAVELACYPVPEVGILFSNFLFRANRTIKMSSILFDAFASPNYDPLAEIGLEIVLKGNHRRNEGFFHVEHTFDDRVLVIKLFPGLKPDYLEFLLDTDIRAFIIEGFGLGNVPSGEKSLVPFVRRAAEHGKIIVITSQVPHGYVDLERYAGGLSILEAGAISAYDQTFPSAIVKLMFLLGHLTDKGAVIRSFQTPIAGEMTVRKQSEPEQGQ
ncbi:asparaginase [bacterium]|nr:asparaginase [bacterium]